MVKQVQQDLSSAVWSICSCVDPRMHEIGAVMRPRNWEPQLFRDVSVGEANCNLLVPGDFKGTWFSVSLSCTRANC